MAQQPSHQGAPLDLSSIIGYPDTRYWLFNSVPEPIQIQVYKMTTNKLLNKARLYAHSTLDQNLSSLDKTGQEQGI